MPEAIGAQIEEVVTKIKNAIYNARLEELGIIVEKIDLTLKAFTKKEAGIIFQIPIISDQLGFNGNISKQEIQTVRLTLVPSDELKLRKFIGEKDIEKDLVEAIQGISMGLKTASKGFPRFKLESASIELNFIIGQGGKITLITKGGLDYGTTHTLCLYLKTQDS